MREPREEELRKTGAEEGLQEGGGSALTYRFT